LSGIEWCVTNERVKIVPEHLLPIPAETLKKPEIKINFLTILIRKYTRKKSFFYSYSRILVSLAQAVLQTLTTGRRVP
jgi:hypothetical protein